MKPIKWVVYILAVVILALHQDNWNFDKVDPRLFGVLPIGLAYHAVYSIVCAILMALLVAVAWPKDLEKYENQMPPSKENK